MQCYSLMRKKSLNFITLGCSKNLVDSERVLGQLPKSRFKISHDANGAADIVVINTCGFINDAKQESIDTILEYVNAKKKGLVEQVLVFGCLSQRYTEDLSKEIPEVDGWFGAGEPEALFAHLNVKPKSACSKRFQTTPSHFAYLKISEGCDRTCSFCAIPMIRGSYRSRTIESLVEEAKTLAGNGVKELLIIAQDISYYGIDLERKQLLAPLLEQLVEVDGIEWIRLHYGYPKNFPEAAIDLMAKHPKICKYLDIPLQHANNQILSAMKRGHSKEEMLNLLAQLRQKVPNIALRTTMLVGFPGETQKEFDELLQFVKDTRIDRLGVFTYSEEEGTQAATLTDGVSENEKQRRADMLMEVQQEISLEINQQKIGKVFKVIIDRQEGNHFVGRTEYDSPEVDNEVIVEDHPNITIGNFVQVKITSASEFELFGKVVESH
ncbi:MAG TPA: 30S ribosomal protein S12 methylthiotransferase RimO [Bacteroidales bacterium]|nr:30S ribosomal protein S12 methylthiotransferase RimO [Bacteroidales bacterium]